MVRERAEDVEDRARAEALARLGVELVVGEGDDWLEILGCGMVHPNVIRAVGLDPEDWQGWLWESWRFVKQIFPLLVVGVFIVGVVRQLIQPEWIQALTYLIPLRYFLEIVRGIFLKGTDLSHLWPQTAALLGFGILILSLSVKRFRQTLE